MNPVVAEIVWVVGTKGLECEHGTVWAFCGVFDRQELAEKAALRIGGFVGPWVLNRADVDECHTFDGAYWPEHGGDS